MFRLYLNGLCEQDKNKLVRGDYDKRGNDMSDVYRGRISVLRELADFKTAIENAIKSEKKKEPPNGVEQSNSGGT
jgi:hypothetical protein